ncbi:MAG: tRNA (adenosine(37)-N6)-threonylcarbamoyltransferase complex dimerization subunit type 1 TsaB [Candidatus Delongbacteria bacterium]|nr:tRNA (adenosine(37)-N6)-threonylcarbamoyltransferase complex dimerization subunit type 1 TsaB [Candidatus Delongbacteria bacterium]
MYILAVDTSTEYCSVALLRNDELLQEINDKTPYSHNKKLFKNIDTILSSNCIKITDIDLLAVGSGPGSFTGLRVGMSALKGIALAVNIKLLPVRSIDAVAFAGIEQFDQNKITVMLDGKQKDMFTASYKKDKGGIKLLSEISVGSYEELIDIKNLTVGNIPKDVVKINDYYSEFFPRAYYIGKIAYLNREKEIEDKMIEPQYYKNFKINKSKKVPLINL